MPKVEGSGNKWRSEGDHGFGPQLATVFISGAHGGAFDSAGGWMSMTSVFRGRFEIKLDAKGRLSLPQGLRSALPQHSATQPAQLIVTNSRYKNQSCLHAYSLAEWENLERRIAKLSALKTDVQAFQRFYLSGGQLVELDAQGRVSIPQSLRKFAGLDSTIVLVGLGAKFEIWSQNTWNLIYDELTENFEETLDAVASLEEPGEE